MRRFLACMILIVTTSASCATSEKQPAPAVTTGTPADHQATAIIAGESRMLSSTIMGADYEINVRTPRAYAHGDDRFPVLYVIDGGLDQDFLHIAGLADLAAVNANFADLIVVGVRTNNRLYELTHETKDPRYERPEGYAGGAEKFRAFLASELIPYINTHYRTSDRRAVIGESLAGLFIVDTFLHTPEAFSDYIAVSPSLWFDDRRLAKESFALLAAQQPAERKLYLTMADEGGTMQKGLDELVAAITKSKPAGLAWTYVDRRKTDHHWTIYHGAALDALRWAFGLPDPDFGEPEWYLIEGANPPGWPESE